MTDKTLQRAIASLTDETPTETENLATLVKTDCAVMYSATRKARGKRQEAKVDYNSFCCLYQCPNLNK
ncbi:MAG: hypothetical protein F6K56_34660 [Moorea sp. SIO3G5]|nr:hypothetical protein [Moorena sp. SIO3G5]